MTFTIESIRQLLQQTGDGVLRQRTWLEASLSDPEGFAGSLFHNAATSAESPGKSQNGIAYDLYHDAVLRHAHGIAAERPCFLYSGAGPFFNPSIPLSALSYAQLHTAASLLAESWTQRGTARGDLVCIIYPLGPELLIALCAAWKLGLVPCLLPPLGPAYLGRRLRALGPQHLVTARRYHSLIGESYSSEVLPLADAVLPEPELPAGPASLRPRASRRSSDDLRPGAQGDNTSCSYGPREAALAHFCPQRDPCSLPSLLAAQALYLGGLCDGLLLGLRPGGNTLAAPEHNYLQYLPTLLFTLLVHGGTYLHLAPEALGTVEAGASAERSLPPIDVLLVGARLRDYLAGRPPRALREVRSCVVQVTEQDSPILWHDFIDRHELTRRPFMTWHYDTASGGCLLFSLRQKGALPRIVYPSPGRPFLLADPRVADAPARGSHGILRPLPGACGLLLYEHEGGYVYGGTRYPSRGGLSLAKEEIEEVVSELPFVAGAVVVPEVGDQGRSTLLCFIGPHARDRDEESDMHLKHAIADHLSRRLGADFVPTTIQILHSLPRRDDNGIDKEWCAQQLQDGQIERRQDDPALHLLDKLSFACYRAATPLGYLALSAWRDRK